MTNPRDVLVRLQWERHREGLRGVRITYLSRGAPDDRAVLDGKNVLHVGRSFLDLSDGGRLPAHRILEIEADGEIVWQRNPSEPNP